MVDEMQSRPQGTRQGQSRGVATRSFRSMAGGLASSSSHCLHTDWSKNAKLSEILVAWEDLSRVEFLLNPRLICASTRQEIVRKCASRWRHAGIGSGVS